MKPARFLRDRSYRPLDPLRKALKPPKPSPFPPPSLVTDPPQISPDLPRSPLLDEQLWKPYGKLHPKARIPPVGFRDPTPLELNPYAQMLASPIRNALPALLRVPRFFAIRFITKKHPDEEDSYWYLPYGIRKDEELQPRKGLRGMAGYVVCNKEQIETVGKGKHYRNLILGTERRLAQWRVDMPEFVEKEMADRCVVEIKELWDKRGREGVKAVKTRWNDPVGYIVWEGEKSGPEEFNLPQLLGEERTKILREDLQVEVPETSIERTLQGVEVFKWLYKLRVYKS